MVRGIAWDSLPSRYEPEKEKPKAKAETTPAEITHQPFEFSRDIPDIGRRIAFGAIVSFPLRLKCVLHLIDNGAILCLSRQPLSAVASPELVLGW